MECISNGLDEYVLYNSFSQEYLECRIFKLLKFNPATYIDVKSFEYISYIPLQSEMYIKNIKITLTSFESIFINYLMINNGYCNMVDFVKHLSEIENRHLNKRNLVVGISRLRKKILIQTGYDVIKCKYGFGYTFNS